MKVNDLIAILEQYKDMDIKDYEVVLTEGKVTLKQKKRKTATKADKILIIQEKLTDATSKFNFHEMSYIFEIMCKAQGFPYVADLRGDVLKIKKVFPKNTEFTMYEVSVVSTFIEIFNTQVRTPDYTSPTWGGIPFASKKIVSAMKAKENRKKVVDSNIVDEVY